MSEQQIIAMAKHALSHGDAGTIEQTEQVTQIPAKHYYDDTRWQQEINGVFKRLPLLLAASAELSQPGDYKAITVLGIPVLISRNEHGKINAMVNSCRHRGAQIVADGSGNSKRFTCPYHAWSYNQQGDLTAIYTPKEFGDIDKNCYQLTHLPCLEIAGLIWVVLQPDSKLDIKGFLANYDQVLAHFNFEQWHYFDQQSIPGPNWKIAYDGYLDFYHLPILHKETFGSEMGNKALYYAWGPHQRVSMPVADLSPELRQVDIKQWPQDILMAGVWTIFPHISIASFYGGGRGVMLSQLLPGNSVGESVTHQLFLMQSPPNEEQQKEAKEQMQFLRTVVEKEDYHTGFLQQAALKNGFNDTVLFGRNEGGAQTFHAWIDKVLACPDDKLNDLFSRECSD